VLEEPGEGQLGMGGAVLGGDSVQRPAEHMSGLTRSRNVGDQPNQYTPFVRLLMFG
jgi:hypothetical protein